MKAMEAPHEGSIEATGLIVIIFALLLWIGVDSLISALQNGYIIVRGSTVYRNRRREEYWLWILTLLFLLLVAGVCSLAIGFLSWADPGAAVGISAVATLGLIACFRRPKEKHPKVDWVLSWVVVGVLLLPGARNAYLALQTPEHRIQALCVAAFCWSAIGCHASILIRRRPILKFIKPMVPKRKR